MDRAKVVLEFNRLYMGDSLLEAVELRIAEATCHFTFNAGSRLSSEAASIFEPEARYAPAILAFEEVHSISCEGSSYQLNSTVVDFGATIKGERDQIEFYIDLTGGRDSDAFLVKLRIVAKSFVFGPR